MTVNAVDKSMIAEHLIVLHRIIMGYVTTITEIIRDGESDQVSVLTVSILLGSFCPKTQNSFLGCLEVGYLCFQHFLNPLFA